MAARIELTCEQLDCVKAALEGHNFSIFGEAGTGKSKVVSEICRRKGSDIQVICSTGIACEVFKGDSNLAYPASTVHSFLGVGTAKGSFNHVVRKACANPVVRKRIADAKCLVWDECSMGSARLLELFHKITSQIRGNLRPFGGIQCILVGDWLQLKPVADKFDDGRPMYLSHLFPCLFPHTIELTIVHRQNEREVIYRNILQQLRFGRCDNETVEDILSLEREIGDQDNAIHLYFTNLLVDAHNVSRLDLLPGDRESFTATDTGNLQGLDCPAPSVSYFKPGAPIIVLYNISANIHNGTRGFFVRKLGDDAAVIRVGGGEHVIHNVSWINVDVEGRSIGSRCQIPLKLHWAATVHKAQGLTLDKVVIHSSYEFTGGLLYTALSRVRSIDDVQVLGFRRQRVCKREKELTDIRNLPHKNLENCPCFKDVSWQAPEDLQPSLEHDEISDGDLLECVQGMFIDAGVNAAGNNEVTENAPSMEEVLEMVEENEHFLAKPPADFNMHLFLSSSKGPTFTEGDENFGNQKNKAVDSAIANIDQFSALVQIVWFKIFNLFQKHLKENIADVKFSVKDLKDFTQQATDISTTAEFRGWLKECFQVPENENLSRAAISIGFDIVQGVFQNMLHIVGDAVRQKSNDDMVSTLNVKEMDNAGLGKVRFVGAWAVSKVFKRAQKYVRDNLYTSCKDTRAQVNKNIAKIEALESTVIVPYEILSVETKYPETLNVTESRQFRTHGLIHVSDKYYEFSLELEQRRIQGLNTYMLTKHGEGLIGVMETTLLNDEQLKSIWHGIFTNVEVAVGKFYLILYN